MRKLIVLITLLFLSLNTYAQDKAFDPKKYGTMLIECFYTLKASATIPFSPVCQDNMKQKIFDLSMILKTQLDENRVTIKNKIGTNDVEELETQIKNYHQYSVTSEDMITAEQRKSMVFWITLSRSPVEKIFIKMKQ